MIDLFSNRTALLRADPVIKGLSRPVHAVPAQRSGGA
jgi:hypothetical protein